MSDIPPRDPNDAPRDPLPKPPPGDAYTEAFQHQAVSARVPEKVARGVMSTGVIVLNGPTEFVVDFLQALAQPRQVATRVILSPPVMDQFAAAVRDNLVKYEQRFGPPPTLPKVDNARRPSIQEIYDELKLPDEQLGGVYANAVMIGHSPSEFYFDFITNFMPRSVVTSRVYLAAPQVPRMLETLIASLQNYQKQFGHGHPRPPQQPPHADGQTPPNMA